MFLSASYHICLDTFSALENEARVSAVDIWILKQTLVVCICIWNLKPSALEYDASIFSMLLFVRVEY